MPSEFKFDRRAISKVVNEGLKGTSKDLQRTFDQVRDTHQGRPVEDVTAASGVALRSRAFTPDKQQLRAWAAAISGGTVIAVKPEGIKL